MEFKKFDRQALIVWLYTLKHLKNIRKFGHVQFVSKRMRYVILYVNKHEVEATIQLLKRQHYVQKIELSYRDAIDMTWEHAIPNRVDKDKIRQSEDDLSLIYSKSQAADSDDFLNNLISTMKRRD